MSEYCKLCESYAREISDLEAKLATKENTITNLIEDNRASQEWYKKQLAEKEKENELMAKTLKMTKFVEKEINQNKISFAVEQLEKVKEDILLDISIGIQREWISNKIDNQIKQLKEMK